ncbi:unnamed protein product [Linum trigynum]|uniref:Chitin-binding type-1 domain-containing protein n=1 Tax=Linum trigynum TaxID=586398 RepID=A0AAV2F1C6_9ROSI
MATSAVTVLAFIALSAINIKSLAPPVAYADERANHTCGCPRYSSSCADCEGGRCCSRWGYCGISIGYCTPCYCEGHIECDPCHCLGNCRHAAAGNQQLPSAAAPGYDGSNIETLVATYDPNLDNVAVATSSSSSSSSVGSATICTGPSSSTTVSTNIVPGGECLLVTNPKNGKQAMVRIMNRKYCSKTSLALDHDAFQQLEDDDVAATHLPVPVGYKYTHCVDN